MLASQGSKVEISNYMGKFDADRLSKCKELFLLCAGSGFTPMIRLIPHALESDNIRLLYFKICSYFGSFFLKENLFYSKVTIIFFNKTSKDILWRSQLDEIRKKNNKWVYFCKSSVLHFKTSKILKTESFYITYSPNPSPTGLDDAVVLASTLSPS